ncbi:MAG: FAD-dependent oxidoreductase [Pseudomonadota bacterium]
MSKVNNTADVLIIGAGLSGLATALLLLEAGLSVKVLEAHSRPGGRIRSVVDPKSGRFLADLGPTWIWPTFQPVITRWFNKLGLNVFPQYSDGLTVLDYEPDQQAKTGFIPEQQGAMRLNGGSQSLTNSLVSRLPENAMHTDTKVISVHIKKHDVFVRTDGGDTPDFSAQKIVIALPPRIASRSIEWKPALTTELSGALDMMPTWMAPHAKVALLYKDAFWRTRGLSGRIASRSGPIVEGHDHCAADGSNAALWGFIGWPHDMRQELGDDLENQILLQLQRCFGQDAPKPLAIHFQDWAANPLVASPEDISGPMHHPTVGPSVLRQLHYDSRVGFAASETAQTSPGLIEGAFDAAERTASLLSENETSISVPQAV